MPPPHPADQTPTFLHDGLRFRDLDHDGVLAPYEDWRLPADARAADLLARMTLEEKAGLLLHANAPAASGPLARLGVGDSYDGAALDDLISTRHIRAFITRLDAAPARLAEQNNRLQHLAAQTRLGIPVLVSSDPRHHLDATLGAGVAATSWFSQWPGPLGLGALGDPDLVQRFGEVVRREYRAIGIHMTLAPQADLASDPRWPRSDGTFGSDPARVRELVGRYVTGVQGGIGGVSPTGVAAVVKHWVGYGASRDGFDGHNYYGRFSAFTRDRLDDHIDAFRDAFAAGVAGVMPSYTILEGVELDGEPLEPVGAGFSAQLLTQLLRRHHGFAGLVVSDWGIMADCNEACRTGKPPQGPQDIAMPWGVEHLSRVERTAKGIVAGLDQLGGEDDPAPVLEAVRRGLVPPQRIDEAAGRVLRLLFTLGLFEEPFVDPAGADRLVGCAPFRQDGRLAQARSVVRLEDRRNQPITSTDTVYVAGMSEQAFVDAGLTVLPDPIGATVAVVRLQAPWETLHPEFFFGARQHEGSLEFRPDDPALAEALRLAEHRPTIVVASLDRPAVLTPLRDRVQVLLAAFGVSDEVIVAVLTGRQLAFGQLPVDLPASMAGVETPGTEAPLYPRGFGRWVSSQRPGSG